MSSGDEIASLQRPELAADHTEDNSSLFGLSYSQQRLWFLDQLEPHNPVYNICNAERINGNLNVEIFEASLAAIVRRHAILRTRFPAVDGEPMQHVDFNFDFSLPRIDLSYLPLSHRQGELESIMKHDARSGFDLARGPLFRAKLLVLDAEEFVWLFTVHQMIWDGWSFRVFYRELEILYGAAVTGKTAILPELPLQYLDYAQRQREDQQGERLQKALSFWRQRLADSGDLLLLPVDRPCSPVRRYNGNRHAMTLPELLAQGLKELGRRRGATLFMTLMAGFMALLHRYSGGTAIVLGCPVTNRHLPDIEKLIGSFVNTLALKAKIAGDEKFSEFLSELRSSCLEGFAHQELPFEQLVEELQPERSLDRNPLFQVFFAFQSTAIARLSLSGVGTERMDVDSGTAKFDLTLSLVENDRKLAGFFEYSSDLFDGATIERMVGHFRTLLEGVVADPHRRISDLPILTEAERRQLLVDWNKTQAVYPGDKCIHELFEAQVEKTPDVVAVTVDTQRLTYRELNTRANQLASHLVSMGVGPEKFVGICVERSLEMVVGLLGILKAGGAYLPLDPCYPPERLEFMLNNAQCSVLLTQQSLIEDGRWNLNDGNPRSSILDSRPKMVCLDRDWPVIQGKGTEKPEGENNSDNLAYVIYTSGSTGQPKGVQVSHRSVVNCLVSIGERVGLTSHDRLLAVTTISFDIAAVELYLPLLLGGTVAIASREEVTDGAALVRRVKSSSATAMQATPSTWRMLIEAEWKGSEEFKILCGGELLSRDLAEALLRCGEVWNLYGPTETTIWSTIHKVESYQGPVPIGRPIANTYIYILDCHLQPVPIGVHGELCIGGDGLAQGYWNQPELTAENFIANPFRPGDRLYKTGDRARYLPDGNVDFIGRTDRQIKIRGYRIELGEIETVLNQHPGVQECVIVVRDSEPSGAQNLVGYFVTRQGSTLSVSELRKFLCKKLPEYMIPSMFLLLDELPLMPNGKIDRNALPLPDGTRPSVMLDFVPPRNEIEEMVAQVWREVLKLETVGIHENFFELGGHSLLATRVAARLRNNFATDLSLRKLFELPTVAALARYIDDLLHDGSGTVTPPLLPVSRDRAIPAAFSQQRLWFLRQLDPDSTAYNISSVFSIRGPLGLHALEESLNGLISRHEILRTTFDSVEGSIVQNIGSFVEMMLPVIDLEALPLDAREAKAREIALQEARKPFDLHKGPLLRVQLLRIDKKRHYLLLNVDHTILDGWSMGTLFKELGILYKARAKKESNPMSALAVQYADYAAWQWERLQGDEMKSQVEYWQRQVGSFSPLNLPMDYPRPALPTTRGGRKVLALSSQLTDSLKELSRCQGVTLFMSLLGAFNILLSRYSGQDDVAVGSTIAGRTRPQLEELIGFFINTLPLRTDLSGNPSFLELLKRIREVCLGAYTYQELPFEKIVEAINPTRDSSRNPLFQVMFNMADVSERVLYLHGCEVTKESFFDPEAKFDMTLYAPEKDGIIELAIVYNADLFSESRITIMLEQFSVLLSQISEKPGAKIGEYSLVSASTRTLLPDPTESLDDAWEEPIHAYVTDWSNRAPDRIALIDANETWTYRELETFSTGLANYLVASGIQPKDVVAIYAQRTSTLVVALLGILKAGAVFVILDPAYPPARLNAYLCISLPKGWIHVDAAEDLPGELRSCLDRLDLSCRVHLPASKQAVGDVLSDQLETEAIVAIGPNDPAYIAFTSGSTGEPKGVLGRHGPITHFLPWQKETFDLRESDRFCLLSGLAYNHLHRDVFTALHLGATIYIPDSETARSPESLAEWFQRNEISVLHLTPALGQLLTTAGEKRLPFVRRILFGGDVLTRQEVAKIRELAPNAKIVGFYGATETQRAVGYYEIPEDMVVESRDGARAIPLGHGIKDVQLLVLNSAGQLAGVGELGEVYVRSPHLAEGYIEDEKLTVEKFVTNPFTNDPNDRLYRTGERGRYLPDGNVEWAGRSDRRVNLRGFRVELAEVETVLKQHPTVKNAAVVLQDYEFPSTENPELGTRNSKLGQRLIAYVAADEDQKALADLLHGYLSTQLPGYMVPAHFEILERLPLGPNGKIDYRSLPAARRFLPPEFSLIQAPRNQVEAKLSVIFSQVLGRERVGIEENFFRIGGHSLLAVQAAARIREAFGVGLELRTFLESPTVVALAKEIEVRIEPTITIAIADDTDREEIEL